MFSFSLKIPNNRLRKEFKISLPVSWYQNSKAGMSTSCQESPSHHRQYNKDSYADIHTILVHQRRKGNDMHRASQSGDTPGLNEGTRKPMAGAGSV